MEKKSTRKKNLKHWTGFALKIAGKDWFNNFLREQDGLFGGGGSLAFLHLYRDENQTKLD